MIYPVLVGYDMGGEPIWKWECDCEKCLTSTTPCQAVTKANEGEKEKPQDTALYASLRR